MINMTAVRELMSRFTPTRSIDYERIFRFRMKADDAAVLLAAHFAAEVQKRNRKPEFDSNILEAIGSLSEFITNPGHRFGFRLCGQCGNGKTKLTNAFREAVEFLYRRGHFDFLDDREYGHRFKPDFHILDVRDILDAAKNNPEKFREIKNYGMLGIDDLGKEPAEVVDYGNTLSPVTELIEYRYSRMLFTCVTTNLVKSEVEAKYGTRITDRLGEMLHKVRFQNMTYRR